MKLDKKLPFFQVSGSEVGARWEQNGVQFDEHGDEIVSAVPVEADAAPVRRTRKKEAEPEAPPPSAPEDQVASQLAGA